MGKLAIKRHAPNLPFLCFVLGLLLGIVIVWHEGVNRLYRKEDEAKIIRKLSTKAERSSQSATELIKAFRAEGIDCTWKLEKTNNGTESSITIVNKPITNILGFGSRWIVELKVDKNGRILRADYDSESVGWL